MYDDRAQPLVGAEKFQRSGAQAWKPTVSTIDGAREDERGYDARMDKTMMPHDRDALAELIRNALTLADDLRASGVAISLNDALVTLTGEGIAPGY